MITCPELSWSQCEEAGHPDLAKIVEREVPFLPWFDKYSMNISKLQGHLGQICPNGIEEYPYLAGLKPQIIPPLQWWCLRDPYDCCEALSAWYMTPDPGHQYTWFKSNYVSRQHWVVLVDLVTSSNMKVKRTTRMLDRKKLKKRSFVFVNATRNMSCAVYMHC